MAENFAETVENIVNELRRLYDIEKAYNLLVKVLEKTSEQTDQLQPGIKFNEGLWQEREARLASSCPECVFGVCHCNQQKKSPEQSDQILAIAEALRKHGLTLVKTAAGYDVVSLGEITAQSEKKSPEQSDHSAVHLHHCNIGEYEGSCKYGDEDCPAMNHAALKAKLAPVSRQLSDAEMAEAAKRYTSPPKNIRVHGWVWKDKQTEDDCYIPSYTPAQHVSKGELFALVDPADLHQPLENTKWF